MRLLCASFLLLSACQPVGTYRPVGDTTEESLPDPDITDTYVDTPLDTVEDSVDTVEDIPGEEVEDSVEDVLEEEELVEEDVEEDTTLDAVEDGEVDVDTDVIEEDEEDVGTDEDVSEEGDVDPPVLTSGFVYAPAGTFTMGSPATEPGREVGEVLHEVTLTRDFEIQTTEVTQGQFMALMEYNPSLNTACGMGCPAEQVSWHEAAAYANALSAQALLLECYTCGGSGATVTCVPSVSYTTPYDCPGYRLPTEAEWEYAARAGTAGGTYNGTSVLVDCVMPNSVLDPIAWFCGNSGMAMTTHPTGYKISNVWGLYDMLGNVAEWCHDWGSSFTPIPVVDPWGLGAGSSRIFRGGSYADNAADLRAAVRSGAAPGYRTYSLGFRLVRTLPPASS